MEKARRLAAELYAAGKSAEEIAELLAERPFTVSRWAVEGGWVAARDVVAAKAAAEALRVDAAADAKFVALADAIMALATGVAAKARTKAGISAKDVLDLARATDLAQKIRAGARKGRE